MYTPMEMPWSPSRLMRTSLSLQRWYSSFRSRNEFICQAMCARPTRRSSGPGASIPSGTSASSWDMVVSADRKVIPPGRAVITVSPRMLV